MGTQALVWSCRISLIILAVITSSSWAAGVHVSLIPSNSNVTAGSEVQVVLMCSEAGDSFNGYEATITWDPSALTLLPTSPLSLQEGNYMTSACGATFHWFQQNTNNVEIGHALWCQGLLLTGPGQLYVVHFRATGHAQTTQVRLASHKFFAGGPTVPSTLMSNATVTIAGTTDVALHTWALVKSLYRE